MQLEKLGGKAMVRLIHSLCMMFGVALFTNGAVAATQQYTYFYDADGDGWGILFPAPQITNSPIAPVGAYNSVWAEKYGDHDDSRAYAHPGAPEELGGTDDLNGDMLRGHPLGPLPPTFVESYNSFTVAAGNTLHFGLAATDSDDPSLGTGIQMQANPSGALWNGNNFSWQTAAGDVGTYQLKFYAVNFSGFSKLDTTVTVTAAVPEPETYGMLMAGLALIGFMARRGKRSAL